MKKDRGKVWLGVAGLVVNATGDWLVVKKSYSGLKGRWSLPAGFVKSGETVDEAVIREVKEETGLDCIVKGLIGFRSGVIREEISDNMAIFYCQLVDENQEFQIQEEELLDIRWLQAGHIVKDELSSELLKEMATHRFEKHSLDVIEGVNPGDIFEYTSYKLFFKNKL